MGESAVELYDELVSTQDDRVRMRLIAQALERLEHRPLPEHAATSEQLRETELRLQKEIEQVRHETEQLRAELKQDIEQARAESQKGIEQVRHETERVRQETEQLRAALQKEIQQAHAESQKSTEQVRSESRENVARLEVQIAQAKTEIVKWMAGLLVFQAMALIGAMAALV